MTITRLLVVPFVASLAVATVAAAPSPLPPGRAAEVLALKNVGLAQLEEGKNAEARKSFEKLATLIPGEALAPANAAVAALRAGDLAGAAALLAKAGALAPQDASVMMIAAALENAKNRPAESRASLARAAAASPRNLEARWRWVRSAEGDPAAKGDLAGRAKMLGEIVARSPSNVAALTKLLLLRIEAGDLAGAKAVAADLEQLLAPLEPKLTKPFSEGKGLLAAGSAKEAGLKFRVVENLLRVGDRYRASLGELYTDVVGLPLESFSPAFEEALRPRAGAPVPVTLARRAGGASGLDPAALLRRADWKNLGKAEVYSVPPPHRAVVFSDLDTEGDLDLFLFGGDAPDRILRNNLDGTTTDVTADSGDPKARSRRAVVEDVDRDGDPDLVTVSATGELILRSNLRQMRFRTTNLGLPSAIDVTAADLDADGFPDLVVATKGALVLLGNRGDGTFERLSGGDLAKLPAGFSPRRVVLADLDNDGFPDVVAGGEAGMAVWRNAGRGLFTSWADATPKGMGRIDEIVPIDADADGDLDLILDEAGKAEWMGNDGGNANGWLAVELEGMTTGSQKVNRAGVGSWIEVKAGDLYVGRTTTTLPTLLGLGKRSRADVLRCVWTNGVPQNLFDQKAKSTVREVQILKGSCPFVYALDGASGTWHFVSDSLGAAPIGLLYDGVHLAGADPREWLFVAGRMLSPDADGTLALDYTEELWEAVYLDQVALAAVDHPAGTLVVPNERIVPYPLEEKLFTAANPRPPRRALADGVDVTELLVEADGRYVTPGQPTAYQGIRTDHDLVLDLGPVRGNSRVVLFLEGWIFYTDTSINVNLSQRSDLAGRPPVLEVPDGRGGWRVAMPSFGFPAGKTKVMAVELTGLVDPADPRVRIRTNLEIRWDRIFATVDDPEVPVRMTTLAPKRATLGYRGFSARYRPTPDGPEFFRHDDISLEPAWPDVPGLATRYGDVTPLLQAADDRYVVFVGGDAVRIEFDAAALPPLAEGQVRDWIVVSDGWDKDFDKNTVTGQSIEPWPFHAMSGYPYPEGERHPDPAFLAEWMTRKVAPERFRDAVRLRGGEPIR